MVFRLPESEQRQQLFTNLGIDASKETWAPPASASGHLVGSVSHDLKRFARLRGLTEIPEAMARHFAQLAVHNFRAFGHSSPRFQVLTVHGAKNREFDHVFVFWSFKAAGWPQEEQRRLLYNAVTRAKRDCTIVALGKEKHIREDPVLGLLGPPQPSIDPAWRKKKSKSREVRSPPGPIARRRRAKRRQKRHILVASTR